MTETMESLTKKITEAEERRKNLLERVYAVGQEVHNLRLRLAKVEFGIEVGGVVQSKQYGPVKVTKIDVKSGWISPITRPWVEGTAKKKDGTWAKRITHIYDDWEAVK